MIAFDLKLLFQNSNTNCAFDNSQFMTVEFVGSSLSSCSSLSYLDNGYFYYGSLTGESFIICLTNENTGVSERPYYRVVRVFASLGNIQDLCLRYEGNKKGRQNELIVAGGKGPNSNISILKKGISLNNI